MDLNNLKFGWQRDLPDNRDYLYKSLFKMPLRVPKVVDLRNDFFGVYDQGTLGSCTANALAGAHEWGQKKQGRAAFTPSRLFIYYNERVILGTVNHDSGARLRDGIKSMAKDGVCQEFMWKYDMRYYKVRPSDECYVDALNHQILSYYRLIGLYDIKVCLSEGYPVSFGFSVYKSFMESDVERTGIAPMPLGKFKDSLLGGHAVLAVGYDDNKKSLIVRNSWGKEWGLNGYFYLPYGYVDEGLADDFWTIKMVE
jgi:C1A family cysteine protease